MAANRRNMKTKTPSYPQNADEWHSAITHGFGLTPEEGKAQHQTGTFPFEAFTVWLRQEFRADKGYNPDFVPALIRNRKGLVAWLYGNGSEPYWPGQDEVNE